MREKLKNLTLILFLLLVSTPIVSAVEVMDEVSNTEYYENHFTNTVDWTGGNTAGGYFYFSNIHLYEDVTLITITGNVADYSNIGYNTGGNFQLKSGETVIGSGYISLLPAGSQFIVHMQFDSFNRGALTGDQGLTITWRPTMDPVVSWPSRRATPTVAGATFNFYGISGPSWGLPITSSHVYYKFTGKANVYSDEQEDISSSWVQRAGFPGGSAYTLNVTYVRGDGTMMMYSNGNTNTSKYFMANEYTTLNLIFPNGYTWTKTYNVEGNYKPAPTPTPTAIPTATPTPIPELCGYWSLAVNTSNILMNEYVQGTLTETDTSDRYDMIDWYRVLPSGQEILALHYVYDPGLFGLGAGWFEVTPTGTAYASSLAEALENDIQFTTAGANHLRVKIYDDVSILPLVYHDYDLVCSLDQVVYVGGTTQASNTLGINVKECDTNALLTGVSIGIYDYLTGQWINKTSEYGGTTYFNVVPGHNVRVLASKSGWLSSDTDYTIPASPGLYEVCLKRPLVDVVNESYVFFNVRDSVTLTGLFQANIQLSDGQIQNTIPSGYAGFSVNDSETYIYTVTKPGYQSFSDSFSVTEDTTIPVKLVQISPTPTLTYPITTLPTVTITGTGTVTPTGTGTGVWSNTTATLSPADKTYKTTKGLDVWYNNIETLSGLLFVAAVFGAIGLISDSMSRRRRR